MLAKTFDINIPLAQVYWYYHWITSKFFKLGSVNQPEHILEHVDPILETKALHFLKDCSVFLSGWAFDAN